MTESNILEFKERLTDKLEREIVAFLNSDGGKIYIGINNEGIPVGVSHIDEIQREISDRIKDNIVPSALGLFDVLIREMNGKNVIEINLSGGSDKPYYWKKYGASVAGCFIRKGSSTIPMPDDMINNLLSKRSRPSIRKIQSPRQDLTFSQLKIYYEEKGFTINSQFLNNLELYTDDGKYNYIAYLLADSNGTSVKVAKYSGKTKYDLIENEELGYCSLLKATDRVLDKFKIENITKTKITEKVRIEKNLADRVALREAIINAIVHTDWTGEVPPLFEIFEDRYVITSYGRLVEDMTKEEFFSCYSRPRSRELMRIFKDVELVEQLGSGMTRILSVYKKSIFEFSDNFIRVTFKFDGTGLIKKQTEKTMLNEQKIIDYINEHKQASTQEISKILNMSMSGARKVIKEMTDNDILIKEGINKSTVYKLKK